MCCKLGSAHCSTRPCSTRPCSTRPCSTRPCQPSWYDEPLSSTWAHKAGGSDAGSRISQSCRIGVLVSLVRALSGARMEATNEDRRSLVRSLHAHRAVSLRPRRSPTDLALLAPCRVLRTGLPARPASVGGRGDDPVRH